MVLRAFSLYVCISSSTRISRNSFFISNLLPHSAWPTTPGKWVSSRPCTCLIKCSTLSRTISWWTAWSAALPCCWNAACATHRSPCTRSKAWRGPTTCSSLGQVHLIIQQQHIFMGYFVGASIIFRGKSLKYTFVCFWFVILKRSCFCTPQTVPCLQYKSLPLVLCVLQMMESSIRPSMPTTRCTS